MPETPLIGSFGFTGELQRGSDVWLRARWYGAGRGGFGSRDPFEGMAQTPYSMQYYQYGYSNPVSNRDPSGYCSGRGDDYCYDVTNWAEFAATYPYPYPQPIQNTPGAKHFGLRDAVILAKDYARFWSNPIGYAADISPANTTLTNAEAFAQYFLGHSLLADDRTDVLYLQLSRRQYAGDLSDQEYCAFLTFAMTTGLRNYEPDRGNNPSGAGQGKGHDNPNPQFPRNLPVIPDLQGTERGQLLKQVKDFLRTFKGTATETADVVEALYTQVSQKSQTRWVFERYNLADGATVFEGPGGFHTVVDPSGKIWKGNPDDYAFDNKTRQLFYDRLHGFFP